MDKHHMAPWLDWAAEIGYMYYSLKKEVSEFPAKPLHVTFPSYIQKVAHGIRGCQCSIMGTQSWYTGEDPTSYFTVLFSDAQLNCE